MFALLEEVYDRKNHEDPRSRPRSAGVAVSDPHSHDQADVGIGPRLESRRRDLYLPVEDALPAGSKTIACFAHVLESHDFDLVFRTSCSSYVDPPNLGEFAKRHAQAERFYSDTSGCPASSHSHPARASSSAGTSCS